MTDLLDSTDQQQPQEAQEQTNQSTDLLGGEQTPDEKDIMQKRINDSQAFIEQLKAEKRQQDEQLKQLQEKMQKLEGAIPTLDQAVKQASNASTSQENQTASLDVDSVKNSVLEELKKQQEAERQQAEQQKQQSLAQSTYEATTKALVDTYGEKAKEVLASKLGELELSAEKARIMMSDPEYSKVFLKQFDAQPAKSSNIPSSGVNTVKIGSKPQEQKPLSKMTSVELANHMKTLREKGN